MLDNGGPALTSALVGRKISPKAGLNKSLKIPNSSIDDIHTPVLALSQISIYSNTTHTRITTSALVLRLVSTTITTTTINSITINNGSTMTGGSRWSARRRAGGREKPQGAKRPRQCGRRGKSVDLRRAAADVNSLDRLERMDQVGGMAVACDGLTTDTYVSFGNGAEGGVAVEPEAVFHGWPQARRECLPGGT